MKIFSDRLYFHRYDKKIVIFASALINYILVRKKCHNFTILDICLYKHTITTKKITKIRLDTANKSSFIPLVTRRQTTNPK